MKWSLCPPGHLYQTWRWSERWCPVDSWDLQVGLSGFAAMIARCTRATSDDLTWMKSSSSSQLRTFSLRERSGSPDFIKRFCWSSVFQASVEKFRISQCPKPPPTGYWRRTVGQRPRKFRLSSDSLQHWKFPPASADHPLGFSPSRLTIRFSHRFWVRRREFSEHATQRFPKFPSSWRINFQPRVRSTSRGCTLPSGKKRATFRENASLHGKNCDGEKIRIRSKWQNKLADVNGLAYVKADVTTRYHVP